MMNFRYLLIGFSVWALLFPSQMEAQNKKDVPVQNCERTILGEGEKPQLQIPRAQYKKKAEFLGIPAIDTIDTQSPDVKIIVYAYNSWNFYRDPSRVMAKEMFQTNWNNLYPDPYHVPKDSLPDKIKIWVVDTLAEFKCPNQVKVYSPFGYRHRRRHNGVDLPLKTGTPVYAAFEGKVRMSRYYKGFGNLVILRHPNGLETFYAHLSKRNVEVDQWVEAGQVIGLGGSTGRSTGPHLHFETRFQGYAFDPQWLIDFEKGELRTNLFILRKKYLDASSKYVPDSDLIEDEINEGDARDYAIAKEKHIADSIAAAKAAAEARAARYHRIKSGDTLLAIAINNGTTVKKICSLNPGLTPKTTLRIGRKIRVK